MTEQRLFYALLALLIWLPLPLASNRPWAEAIFVIWITLIAFFWFLHYQTKQTQISPVFYRAKWVVWLMVGLLLWLALQIIPLPEILRQSISPQSVAMYQAAAAGQWQALSIDPYASLMYWLKSVAYGLLFVMVLILVNSKLRLVMIGYALVLSGLFQAVYGSLLVMTGTAGLIFDVVPYGGRATGSYVNPDHLAGYMEMVSAVGIGLLLATTYSKSRPHTWRHTLRNLISIVLSQKLILRLVLVVLVIALVMTHSRMGNTGFFSSMLIAGAVLLLSYRKQEGSIKKMFTHSHTRSAVLLVTSLMLIDMFIVGSYFGVEKVVHRISNTTLASEEVRIDLNVLTPEIIKDYPVTGSGGGTFQSAYHPYQQEASSIHVIHAHEDYLELMSDTGMVGFAILGLIVLLSLSAAIKALWTRRDPLTRGIGFAVLMAVSAILIHSTVDFNLQIPANAATFVVILALGWIALHLDRPENSQRPPKHVVA